MRYRLLIPLAALAVLMLTPAPAAADATAFFGVSPTTTMRPASGLAIAVKVLLIGIEFEYGHIDERTTDNVPGINSSLFNVVLATPTKVKFYVTAGGGWTYERLGADTAWGAATNIGGGVKLPLAGPIRLRLDYRVLNVHGTVPGSIDKRQQRFYAGINFAF